jgi:hypothetical protein
LFVLAQEKIRKYIEKQNEEIKLKVNSQNIQESDFSKGIQKNDGSFCAIYVLIFIFRICVLDESFKEASEFDFLKDDEKEIQQEVLQKYSMNENNQFKFL